MRMRKERWRPPSNEDIKLFFSAFARFAHRFYAWNGYVSKWFIQKVNLIKHSLSFSVSTCSTMACCCSCCWLQSEIKEKTRKMIEQNMVWTAANQQHGKSKRKRTQNPTQEYKIYSHMNGFAWIWWHSTALEIIFCINALFTADWMSKMRFRSASKTSKCARTIVSSDENHSHGAQTNQASHVIQTANIFVIIIICTTISDYLLFHAHPLHLRTTPLLRKIGAQSDKWLSTNVGRSIPTVSGTSY